MTRVCWEQLGSVRRQAGREDIMKLDPNEEHLQGVRKEVSCYGEGRVWWGVEEAGYCCISNPTSLLLVP